MQDLEPAIAYQGSSLSLFAYGGRGFAILTGRWRTLRQDIAGPRIVGGIVGAALHLTHLEYRYLPGSAEITSLAPR